MRTTFVTLSALAVVVALALTGAFATHVDAATGSIPLNCKRACPDQGTVNKGVLSDGRSYKLKGFNRPSGILAAEAFLVENGKIRRVEMVGPSAPYHINSSWPEG